MDGEALAVPEDIAPAAATPAAATPAACSSRRLLTPDSSSSLMVSLPFAWDH